MSRRLRSARPLAVATPGATPRRFDAEDVLVPALLALIGIGLVELIWAFVSL